MDTYTPQVTLMPSPARLCRSISAFGLLLCLAGCAPKPAPVPVVRVLPSAPTPPALPVPIVMRPQHQAIVVNDNGLDPDANKADVPAKSSVADTASKRMTLEAKSAAVSAEMQTLSDDYDAADDKGMDIYARWHYHARYERMKQQKAGYDAQAAALH